MEEGSGPDGAGQAMRRQPRRDDARGPGTAAEAVCRDCQGTGLKEDRACPICGGTGRVGRIQGRA